MSSLILSRTDVDFLLFDWLKVEDLTQRERYQEHSRETFAGALDTYASIAEDFFAPHNKSNDHQEPTFDGERVAASCLATCTDPERQHFYRGKLQTCAYFQRWELPRIGGWLQVVRAEDRTCVEMQDAWF